jgi:NodT family efflux transporter outer membrane factor (OMF) lipoprotein
LLGKNPGDVDKELDRFAPIPVPPVKVVIGIPANTIRNRPDVRRAEMKLIAATAAVGKAKAELYPQVRLSGSIGLESISKGDLFKWASRTWHLATNITWKIFHAGELRQNVKVYTERQKQALYEYQNAVLNAIEEVRNAIVAYVKEQKRLYALKKAVEAARKSYELALDRYRAGISDFIDVLDAERSLQSLQDQLSVSKGMVVTNFVRIYKALGGGSQQLLNSEH